MNIDRPRSAPADRVTLPIPCSWVPGPAPARRPGMTTIVCLGFPAEGCSGAGGAPSWTCPGGAPYKRAMRRIAFHKMHGLGNDFVVLDQRRETAAIDAAAARALADRHTGIGCDQLILIEPPRDPSARVFMRILNADGSETAACGNGARCIARLIAEETGERHGPLETPARLLHAALLP